MDINALYAAMKGSPLVGPLYSLCPHPNFAFHPLVPRVHPLLTPPTARSSMLRQPPSSGPTAWLKSVPVCPLAWKNGERLFGQDVFNLATRFPKDSYSSLKYLLGMPVNADVISYYTSFTAPDVAPSTCFTASVRRGSSTAGDSGVMPAILDVEELVAMQLAYVRSLAVDVAGAGERVQDIVVTVPAFFSQFERDAIADAIELAGLRLLALVNDGAAIVVNYAMTRQFPEPERHIVYDAGEEAGYEAEARSLPCLPSPSTLSPSLVPHPLPHAVSPSQSQGGTQREAGMQGTGMEN
ncbi:hypothetical protein BJV77DRAFT_1064706 [Russula vinacea]|nr:hypothetical protein BJV77DRAFT_1064706 [Russula vinacea]